MILILFIFKVIIIVYYNSMKSLMINLETPSH